MTRLAVLACCGALLANFSSGNASPKEPADALVYDAMAAPATVSYEGLVQTVRIGNDGSEASEYRVEHRAPNQTLRKFESPSSLMGDYVITSGVRSYAVDVNRKRVTSGKDEAANDQIAIDNNYLLLRRNYHAVQRNSEALDGRSVVDVALINNYTQRTTMIVKIDTVTKLVLDKQQFAGNGALISETRFESVRYDVQPAASDFALPKGYRSVSGQSFSQSDDPKAVAGSAGFATREPKYLPDGFSPVQGSVVVLRGVRTLQVLYSDGLRTVSLFENGGSSAVNMNGYRAQSTTISGHDADYAEAGPTTLLSWRGDSLHYTLVGELQLDELKKIASSL